MGRFIIFGAGAVGGLIGGRLHLAGHDVILVARGAHRDALVKGGLHLRTTAGEDVIRLKVVGSLSEIVVAAEDTIVLSLKTQDAGPALEQIAAAAPAEVTIVCAQNGVESERLALRLFSNVYGAYVYVYSAVTTEGTVACYTFPCLGIVDIGHCRDGADERATAMAADLTAAGFDSVARADIMRWKRGKLIVSTGTAVRAVCGASDEARDITDAARREAELCFRAAKLDFLPFDDAMKRARVLLLQSVDGRPFPGGSISQGLARGRKTTEVDYLNGEISLLGRLYGIATPVNALMQRLVREMARADAAPGSVPVSEVRRRLAMGSSG